ncbi:MAG: sigma-54 dependent transcriptional regulator [Deltaproteobacteria bacterium]|jgi:DNA-binding NtrC family response regulator
MAVSEGHVLIVDDDPTLLEMLEDGLVVKGFEVKTATSGQKGLEIATSENVDVIVSDLNMDGMSGLELSEAVAAVKEIPVIVLTGEASTKAAIEALRLGVYDFLLKPVKLDILVGALRRAVERRQLRLEVEHLRNAVAQTGQFEEIVGESHPMKELVSLVARVAPADVSVLVTGESGTGKELVARALHKRSNRAEGPFVAINCAAMPATLLESELFGHVQGAFTDAKAAKDGLFLQADGGTLFLDEIGDMPMEMQAKLLRALQEQKVRPVGGSEERAFDVRIVAATNKDLDEAVEDGRFREDLFYRVNVVRVPTPPLRARGRDILLLAQHFVDRAAERAKRPIRGISPNAAEKLVTYDWPGNVRELENCIERGVALAQGEQITIDDLPERVQKFETVAVEPDELGGQLLTVQELERRHIIRVLEAVEGNKTRAAEVLGFDRRTLYRKLERYGIEA